MLTDEFDHYKKKEVTDMWMIIFERSKSYILKKKRRKKKKRWKMRK